MTHFEQVTMNKGFFNVLRAAVKKYCNCFDEVSSFLGSLLIRQ